MYDKWNNNLVQFARLLCEIEQAGGITDSVMQTLQTEMDLHEADICTLLERAQTVWDNAKKEKP